MVEQGFSLDWALKDLDTVDASAYVAGLLVVVIASMKRMEGGGRGGREMTRSTWVELRMPGHGTT